MSDGQRVEAFAPGRVNLIGEHTDYNDGLALPFAIELGVRVTATPLTGDEIHAIAVDLGEEDRFAIGGAERRGVDGAEDRFAIGGAEGRGVDGAEDRFAIGGAEGRSVAAQTGWRAFVRGVVAELLEAGVHIAPTRLEIAGDLPRGGGLSSSAALTVSLALALLRDAWDEVRLARLCSRVENNWVGARTGLLDQLASLCGRPGHVLRIDFRDLTVEPIAFDPGDWSLAVMPSGDPRQHAASGYNARRAECAKACELLGVASLRDVGDPSPLPEPLRQRVQHVIEENHRVERAIAALQAGDMPALGRLLDASHASLRDRYECSTPSVERTVASLHAAGAAGARMIGGGFGGHVLALLPPGVVPPAGALIVTPADGALVSAGVEEGERVHVSFEERYWYPEEGGEVWVAGYQLVDPASGRFLGRDAPELHERGLRVAAVAGAGAHHAEALAVDGAAPGRALELRRDLANAHDPNAIAIHPAAGGDQLGWVPRELAAEIAPKLDAGEPWSAVVLREQRRSPRDARHGLTMLLAPGAAITLVGK